MAEGSEGNRSGSGASFWGETLEDWRRSGLKQSDYQRQHGLTKNAFTYWKLKLLGSARSEARLVAVPRVAVGQGGAGSNAGGISIRVGGRYVVEVGKGFERSALSQVLEVLEGRLA